MTDTTTRTEPVHLPITPRPLRVAYIGNFQPPHSTENHVATAWSNNDHMVVMLQEQLPESWETATKLVATKGVDLLMWTRTGGLSAQIPHEVQRRMLAEAEQAGTPTVGYHLDRWWGLDRAGQIAEEPFFECALVCTADGGHNDHWANAQVNHHWMPPAVSRTEAQREPTRRPPARINRVQVGFVGNLDSYHPEWLPYRQELKAKLRAWYGHRFNNVPGGMRGQPLVDYYRTVPVIVGDSCLAPNANGGPMTHYWSDRIPETLGRGGYLLHPWVEGLEEEYHGSDGCYAGPSTWPLGDWDTLRSLIDAALAHPQYRADAARHMRAHVLEHHTYEKRMDQLVVALVCENLLPEVLA